MNHTDILTNKYLIFLNKYLSGISIQDAQNHDVVKHIIHSLNKYLLSSSIFVYSLKPCATEYELVKCLLTLTNIC